MEFFTSGLFWFLEGVLACIVVLGFKAWMKDRGVPGHVLVPGLFTRLRMPIDRRDKALLVTERAIGADQGGNYLLAVTSENTVEKRMIRMGQLVDGLRVIEEGLQAGEWIIVKGVQRARPGAKVDPEKIDMTSLTVSVLKEAAEAKQKEVTAAKSTEVEQTAAAAELKQKETEKQENPEGEKENEN